MTERIELIERFLEGKLNAEELKAFQDRVQTDATFAAEVETTRQMLQELKTFGKRKELKTKLEAIHQKMPVHSSSQGKLIRFKAYFKTIAVAASVALVTSIASLLAVNYWNTPHAERAYYRELRMDVDKIKLSHNKMWREIYNDRKIVNPGNFSGTGFAISAEGYVATSYHLVREADSVFLENDKFSRIRAQIMYFDKSRDLAILKVIEPDFKSFGKLPYGFTANDKDLGERIFTLGFPREDIVYGEGYISSSTGYDGDSAAYQVSIPVNPGNSGGPLLDERGNIAGVVSGKHTENEGTAFALKTVYLQNIVKQLQKDSADIHIDMPSKSKQSFVSHTAQVKKIQDFIFRVKVYK